MFTFRVLFKSTSSIFFCINFHWHSHSFLSLSNLSSNSIFSLFQFLSVFSSCLRRSMVPVCVTARKSLCFSYFFTECFLEVYQNKCHLCLAFRAKKKTKTNKQNPKITKWNALAGNSMTRLHDIHLERDQCTRTKHCRTQTWGQRRPAGKREEGHAASITELGTSAPAGSVPWPLRIFVITPHDKLVFPEIQVCLTSNGTWGPWDPATSAPGGKSYFYSCSADNCVCKGPLSAQTLLSHMYTARQRPGHSLGDWRLDCKLDMCTKFSWLQECPRIREGKQGSKANTREQT